MSATDGPMRLWTKRDRFDPVAATGATGAGGAEFGREQGMPEGLWNGGRNLVTVAATGSPATGSPATGSPATGAPAVFPASTWSAWSWGRAG